MSVNFDNNTSSQIDITYAEKHDDFEFDGRLNNQTQSSDSHQKTPSWGDEWMSGNTSILESLTGGPSPWMDTWYGKTTTFVTSFAEAPLKVAAGFLSLGGCNGPEDDDTNVPDTEPTPPRDSDGDGYYTCDPYEAAEDYEQCLDELVSLHDGEAKGAEVYSASELNSMIDCDDYNATVHPMADESCNGIDDDCNGEIDDSVIFKQYWPDVDGDGYGDMNAEPVEDCVVPEGHVDNAEDCDDSDPDISPETLWYADADGDGYGDPNVSIASCTQPENHVSSELATDGNDSDPTINPETIWYADFDFDGYVDSSDYEIGNTPSSSAYIHELDVLGEDCDDTNNTVYPGADELCDGIDNDCDSEIDEEVVYYNWYLDVDGDGYGDAGDTSPIYSCSLQTGRVTNNSDCNDNDPEINPAASETCNGLDDNCNGSVDDGLTFTTYYTDADGDGYGDMNDIGTEYCLDPGTGFVTNNTDCDDTDASVWSEEIVYGDADGDGYTDGSSYLMCIGSTPPAGYSLTESAGIDCDDGDASVYQYLTGYADFDFDGYTLSIPTSVCSGSSLPTEYLSSSTTADCDDSDSSTYPGAIDYCDGVDRDCDGTVDEADSFDADTWNEDADGDNYGNPNSTTTACYSAPSGYVADATDCNDDDPDENPGETEDVDRIGDEDCDGQGFGSLTQADAEYEGDSWGDYVGNDLSNAGDIDGDSIPDLLVGAPGNQAGNPYGYGEAVTLFGHSTSFIDTGEAHHEGEAEFDYAGAKVLGNIDLDDDGVPDIVVGAPEADYNYSSDGAIYFISGGYLADVDLASYDHKWHGQSSNDAAGYMVESAGDFNCDGIDDLVVGAPYSDNGGANSGEAYVILGPITASGITSLHTGADIVITGLNANDRLGYSATAVDLDADGCSELVISAHGYNSEQGAVYVFQGTPTPPSTLDPATDAIATFTGENSGDRAGISVKAIDNGDLTGDGNPDLVIGADYNACNGYDSGAVYVMSDPLTSASLSVSLGAKICGDSSANMLGFPNTSVDVGDLDGDGLYDLLIGSFANPNYYAGAASLFLGPISGSYNISDANQTLSGDPTDGYYTGWSAAFLEDTNGDGFLEVAVGDPEYGYYDTGKAYVVSGETVSH